ncbi:hypothetical protein C8J57DRAFT_1298526 [Mycena rebaudengoi]|nr:hypothetical protein C8J57DRAFT_1298526 [Mycena rebaudengoi]
MRRRASHFLQLLASVRSACSSLKPFCILLITNCTPFGTSDCQLASNTTVLFREVRVLSTAPRPILICFDLEVCVVRQACELNAFV